jgi:uncharacterized protein
VTLSKPFEENSLSAAQQIKLLHDLQQIDQKIMDVERFRQSAPTEIEKRTTQIEQHRQMITDKEAALKEAKQKRREKETELEQHEAHITKNQQRMFAVKSNEELHAIQKENTRQKEMVEELEDQILQVMDEIESAELAVKKAKERFAEIEKGLLGETAELQAKLDKVNADLEKMSAAREKFVPKIEPTFLTRYTKLRRTTGGVAVVRVVQRTCQGCRMNVPPQIYNLVIRNEDIITCPQCYRILFYEPAIDDTAANGGSVG